MARHFDSASSQRIAVPSGATLPTGVGTSIAAIVKLVSPAPATVQTFFANGAFNIFVNASAANFGGSVRDDSGVSPSPAIPVAAGEWILIANTKPSGTAMRRHHYYRFSTDSWVRGDSTNAADNTVATSSATSIGSYNASANFCNADIAVIGYFGAGLSDEQMSSLPYSLNAWTSLNPAGLWVLDQHTSQGLPNWAGTGGNATSLGTSTAATSEPPLSYGHPVIIATREASGSTGTVAATLPALGASATGTSGTVTPPVVTGTPQAAGFTTSGTVVTYTGGGTTGLTTYDLLLINSDNTVTVPEFGAPIESRVGGQGAYIFARQYGTTTATINLGGGINTDTSVLWLRITNTGGYDTSTDAGVDSSSGNTTPALTSSALATATELAVAFAATHSQSATIPAGLTWSAGYTQQVDGSSGTGTTGVYGAVAVKAPAGTAAESPSASWSNGASPSDRYLLFAAFLGAISETVSGTVDVGLPALQAAVVGVAGSTASVAIGLPALTTAVVGTSTATGSAAVGLPALQATAVGTASATGTAAVVLPALTASAAGAASASGAVAATLPSLAAAVVGTASATGTSAVTLPALQAAVVGDVAGAASGGITAVLPAMQASVAGAASASGALAAVLPALTGQAVGASTATATAAAILPALTASAAGQPGSQGTVGITLPALRAAVVGGPSTVTAVATIGLPALVAAANGTSSATGVIAATLPALTVSVSDAPVYTRRPGILTAGTRRSRLTAGALRGPTTGA